MQAAIVPGQANPSSCWRGQADDIQWDGRAEMGSGGRARPAARASAILAMTVAGSERILPG